MAELTCWKCQQPITDDEFWGEADGTNRHLNACPPREITDPEFQREADGTTRHLRASTREITHGITIEVLYPWLEEGGLSEPQLDAYESYLEDALGVKLLFAQGAALLVHVDRAIEALEGIYAADLTDAAEHEKDADLVNRLARELTNSGVRYWLIGADTLPLEV